MEADRKKMSEYMGDTVEEPLQGHYAWFYRDEMGEPVKVLIRRHSRQRRRIA
jgi:hypothetical protein